MIVSKSGMDMLHWMEIHTALFGIFSKSRVLSFVVLWQWRTVSVQVVYCACVSSVTWDYHVFRLNGWVFWWVGGWLHVGGWQCGAPSDRHCLVPFHATGYCKVSCCARAIEKGSRGSLSLPWEEFGAPSCVARRILPWACSVCYLPSIHLQSCVFASSDFLSCTPWGF